MSRRELKYRARYQLGNGIFQNAWLIALLVGVIFAAIETAAGAIGIGIGAVVVMGPLTYGYNLIFLKQARDNEPMNITDMFSGFTTDFSQTFLIGLMTTIFTFLWALLFIIPGIVKAYSYSAAYYIKADHPEYDWRMCIAESCNLMRGRKWELFMLDLSFLGWYIVGALCLGVGTLWVVPYHEAARAHFYNELVSYRIF